jgi:hypothetical protein
MFALHAKDQVGPAEMAVGDLDARAVLRAGAARFVTRMILEQRFRRRAAPLVARADEEELGFQDTKKAGRETGPVVR